MRLSDPKIKAAFDAYPAKLRAPLLKLREIIFEAAAETPGVGKLTETLKWGEPAYLPATPKIGTTIRIGVQKGSTDRYAAFFHCQTTLVATFREVYPKAFVFEGNRALIFTIARELPDAALKHCIALALTYHTRNSDKRCFSPRDGGGGATNATDMARTHAKKTANAKPKR